MLDFLQNSVQKATQHVGDGSMPTAHTPLSELKLPLDIKWRRSKDLPFGMYGYPQVVMLKEKVYIGGGTAPSGDEQIVIVYDPEQDSYSTLPPYENAYFSMVVVNDQLVLVGRMNIQTDRRTNKVGVWNELSREWTDTLPPMIIACNSPSVATHNNRWLVMMGGYNGENHLSRVEILDTIESRQWCQAASLPQPCAQALPATVGNICYLLGGFTEGTFPSSKVFSVCFNDLISQAAFKVSSASVSSTCTSSPWKPLPDTPLTRCTALAFNGALLAVGEDSIYHYQPSSQSWVDAGELPTIRLCCTCTVLPCGDLYVAGGGAGAVARVDIASLK